MHVSLRVLGRRWRATHRGTGESTLSCCGRLRFAYGYIMIYISFLLCTRLSLSCTVLLYR